MRRLHGRNWNGPASIWAANDRTVRAGSGPITGHRRWLLERCRAPGFGGQATLLLLDNALLVRTGWAGHARPPSWPTHREATVYFPERCSWKVDSGSPVCGWQISMAAYLTWLTISSRCSPWRTRVLCERRLPDRWLTSYVAHALGTSSEPVLSFVPSYNNARWRTP
jgi:hypothetical protein